MPAATRVTARAPGARADHDGAGGAAAAPALAPLRRPGHPAARAGRDRRSPRSCSASAAIFASQQLLSDDEGPRGPQVGAIDPADVKVAVLNGTSINGLAGKVGSDVESSGYDARRDHQHHPGFDETVVLYADRQKPAAQKVAGDLGVKATVEPLDRDTRELAAGADVVVIAGEDRA